MHSLERTTACEIARAAITITIKKPSNIRIKWELIYHTTVCTRRFCIHFTLDAQLRLGLGVITYFHSQNILTVYRCPSCCLRIGACAAVVIIATHALTYC